MVSAQSPTTFSIAKDGKHHDATFIVEGDCVSVIYWSAHGVVRRKACSEQMDQPEQTARMLLREMI
jgi:5-enolpyruvylshikimate-3-phosphate synthase